MRIRKQVHELTPDDLESFNIWEFCLDEETSEEQDETTVRPRPDLAGIMDCSDGDLLCAAEFVLADGTSHRGWILPRGESDIRSSQPVIVTKDGMVGFWHGVMKPRPEDIAKAYARLGRTRETVFPVSFHSMVEVEGKRIHGALSGFAYLEDDLSTVSQVR